MNKKTNSAAAAPSPAARWSQHSRSHSLHEDVALERLILINSVKHPPHHLKQVCDLLNIYKNPPASGLLSRLKIQRRRSEVKALLRHLAANSYRDESGRHGKSPGVSARPHRSQGRVASHHPHGGTSRDLRWRGKGAGWGSVPDNTRNAAINWGYESLTCRDCFCCLLKAVLRI